MNDADFHLKQILDASIPLLIIKKDFTMHMVNQTYCTYFNKKEEDILGRKCHEIYRGPFCNTPQCAMEQVMGGKEQYEYEWEETFPDGRKAFFLVRAVPYRSADGNIVGIIENFTDITEKKKLEENLRFISSITEQVQDSILVTDKSFKITFMNRAAETLYGYSQEELLGKEPIILNAEPMAEQIEQGIYDTVQSGNVWTGTHLSQRKDGSTFVCELKISPLSDDQGHPIAFIGIMRDITAQVAAEEALKESESRFSGILSSMTDFVFAFDAEGCFIFYHTPRVEDLYVPPEQFIGKKYSEVLPEHINKQIEKALKKNKKGDAAEYEYDMTMGDRTRWFSAKMSPVFLEDQFRGSVSVVREITRRKKREDKIKKSLHEKEVLLKEINHRVKNNLQVIVSLLNLQSRHIRDKQAREMFTDSRNRIKAMALIHERLYHSENLAAIDFSEYVRILVRHLSGLYKDAARAEEIHLDVRIQDIFLDINTAIPCALIVNELVTNALKHAFQGDTPGKINISMSPVRGDRIKMLVHDNGVGFPENIDFTQTKSFGMQLVMTLVEQIEGSISLNRHRGTAFEIEFPRREESLRIE